MNRIELAQRGRGRPMTKLLAAMTRFGTEDGIGLRHQRAVVRRRARRYERGEHHTGQRRMQSARVHAGPQHDAGDHIRRNAIHARAIEQHEESNRGQRARERQKFNAPE